MRAILLRDAVLENEKILLVEGESAHHLNVVRVKKDETILILNGNGVRAKASVMSFGKKSVELKILHVESHLKKNEMILFIGVPKKDAFEDILKNAIECGFTKIIPLTTKYSQYEVQFNERLEKIIESALIQSNNTFAPNIYKQMDIKDLDHIDVAVDHSLLMSVNISSENKILITSESNLAVFIGPEAGFDSEEEKQILKSKFNVGTAQMPCPILRAPTAVAVSAGYMFSLRNKILKQ